MDLTKGCQRISAGAFCGCKLGNFHAKGVQEIMSSAFADYLFGEKSVFSAAVLGDMKRIGATIFSQKEGGHLKNLVIGRAKFLDEGALVGIPSLETLTIMAEDYTPYDLRAVEHCCKDSKQLQRISVPETLRADSKAYLQELSVKYNFQLRFFSLSQVSNRPQAGEIFLW